jgi:hypothetical protein
VLWVDALCINQEDVLERNQQVAQMSSVYRSSKLTLIWLGLQTEADISCINILQQIETIKQNIYDDGWKDHVYHRDLTRHWIIVKAFQQSGHIDAIFASMEAFFSKSWFRRVWVVQELLLSPEIQICCGPKVIPADAIGLLSEFCDSQKGRMLRDMNVNLHDRLSTLSHFSYSRPVVLSLVDFAGMAASSQLEASDERDYVYGFLGLLDSEKNSTLWPDYTLDLADVFRDAMVASLDDAFRENEEDEQWMHFWHLLALANILRPSPEKLFSSWTIYFPSTPNNIWNFLSFVDLFSASKHAELTYSFGGANSSSDIASRRYVVSSIPVISAYALEVMAIVCNIGDYNHVNHRLVIMSNSKIP